MNALVVSHTGAPFEATIQLPTSKSISNRALILEALSGTSFPTKDLSDSADTEQIKKLLLAIHQNSNNHQKTILDCENAGTVFRFLTAYLARHPGIWELTGSDRMKERPIGPLVEALRTLGAQIEYTGEPGYPPIRITGKPLKGKQVAIDPGISSQFITAMLLIAPTLKEGLEIRFTKKPSSLPYIHMTLNLLRHYGIHSTFKGDRVEVLPQKFKQAPLTIEPDWSAASFWYTIVALSNKGSVFLAGLQKESLQGDAILPELYNSLGVKSRFEKQGIHIYRNGKPENNFHHDFTDHPDLLQPILATCAGLGIKASFTGLESLRIKETDRITAMVKELHRLGIECGTERNPDWKDATSIQLENQSKLPYFGNNSSIPTIQTYGDHRMAMAFAPLSQRFGPMKILDPGVVVKSYPGFWNDLQKAGFVLERSNKNEQ